MELRGQVEMSLREWEVVDSVRSHEPSPYGSACGGSILHVPNMQDSQMEFGNEGMRWFVAWG